MLIAQPGLSTIASKQGIIKRFRPTFNSASNPPSFSDCACVTVNRSDHCKGGDKIFCKFCYCALKESNFHSRFLFAAITLSPDIVQNTISKNAWFQSMKRHHMEFDRSKYYVLCSWLTRIRVKLQDFLDKIPQTQLINF